MTTSRHFPAITTIIFIAVMLIAGLLPILWLATGSDTKIFDTYTLRILTFTLWQALLSTTVSVAIGLPAALALARRQFPGRNLLTSFLALPLALPQIVVVLALVGLFGENGWLRGTLQLYGLSGILLAHVFFNATLATRLLLHSLQAIPAEQFRLAGQLGFSDLQHFKIVDWPALKQSLSGTALLIFLLCSASFTIVLTLGGGPQATTLETAIFQSLRADFDPARAAGLALLQLLLCLALGLAILRSGISQTQATLRLTTQRYDGTSLIAKFCDTLSLFVLACLLVLPVATLLVKGLPSIAMSWSVLRATFTSLLFATSTAALACTLAYALAHAAARSKQLASLSQLTSLAGLALPSAVIATGWFLIAIKTTGLSMIAAPLIIALNVLLALPYAYGIMVPAMRDIAQQDRLAASLNLAGWNRFWTIDRYALSAPLITAFAMAAALALGDLAAILFFGDGQYLTLPALIYQQMGSYRMQGAMGTAVLLAAVAAMILFIAEKAGQRA